MAWADGRRAPAGARGSMPRSAEATRRSVDAWVGLTRYPRNRRRLARRGRGRWPPLRGLRATLPGPATATPPAGLERTCAGSRTRAPPPGLPPRCHRHPGDCPSWCPRARSLPRRHSTTRSALRLRGSTRETATTARRRRDGRSAMSQWLSPSWGVRRRFACGARRRSRTAMCVPIAGVASACRRASERRWNIEMPAHWSGETFQGRALAPKSRRWE